YRPTRCDEAPFFFNKVTVHEMAINWKKIGMVIFAIVIAAFFIAAGLSKVMQPEDHTESFVRWGYPAWFVYFTGVVELCGAGLLLVPRVRLYGVMLLGVTMIAAALTHFQADEMAAVPVPLVLLVLVGALGFFHWKRSGQ
ncbi:MAG: DoxX family protein, partial [Nitrospirales bacterium]